MKELRVDVIKDALYACMDCQRLDEIAFVKEVALSTVSMRMQREVTHAMSSKTLHFHPLLCRIYKCTP